MKAIALALSLLCAAAAHAAEPARAGQAAAPAAGPAPAKAAKAAAPAKASPAVAGPPGVFEIPGRRFKTVFEHAPHAAVACARCHPGEKPGRIAAIQKEAAHKFCVPCHQAEKKGPWRCFECHQRGQAPDQPGKPPPPPVPPATRLKAEQEAAAAAAAAAAGPAAGSGPAASPPAR